MTVILLRHGRSTSNTAGMLAGRSEGVDLDDKGREQAAGLVERLGELPIKALVRSPLLRCRTHRRAAGRSAGPGAASSTSGSPRSTTARGPAARSASWSKEPLWRVVQAQPSAAVFPDGEGLAQVQARAVSAVREHDRRLAERARRRCAVGGVHPRRCHQGGGRRRARHPPGRVPAHHRGPGVGERDPLHTAAPVRHARQPHRAGVGCGADAPPPRRTDGRSAEPRADVPSSDAVVGGSTTAGLERVD